MEKKFGGPMTDLFLLRQSTYTVTIQVQALEALRCRHAGHWKNTDLDDLVQKLSWQVFQLISPVVLLTCISLGDTDLFSPVVMWTHVNLLWDSPSPVPSKLNPMQLPFPSKDYFAGMFGEQSWDLFVTKCTNTIALYQIQGGTLIVEVHFGGASGQTLGWIMHTIPSLYAVHTATGDGRPVEPNVYQLAQSCATNCELYLFTIQKLDHVHRLFMVWQ
ncbi:protein (fungal and plant) [Purpureocillium lavendulum]|uniref:Protein (Fungal and plant) n=1 Tax=Purpureocillium lavendulum TaxID=1247861 RepID=A0AB34G2C4_9HYPO|nr:protein (fungal and plant) [Purpureocillium lavendulum]